MPGLSNSNYVEIKSGLSEGDVVYYTESQTFDFGGIVFGGMPGGDFGGDMPDMSGGGMPSGGGAPSGGPGGGMPGGRG